jgi:hypothetical protein
VAGSDGIARTRAETGHRRQLGTVFGEVTVTRMAYRAPGAANLYPADAALNLPEEKHSHGLRRLAAVESARGSFESAAAAVTRATGTVMGKSQVEELALRAAADVDAFYAARRPGPAGDDQLLVLTFDGKGIVMRPDALRPANARAARTAQRKLATRLSPGEKHGRKRMAELAAVYDAAPVPRAAADIITRPGHDARRRHSRGPQAAGKWLTGSVTSDISEVIAAGFAEAGRRDPGRRRTWMALVDGNATQIEAIKAEAARRVSPCPSSAISSTSLSTCGKPPGPSSAPATPTPKPGSPCRQSRSWRARPPRSRRGSAAGPVSSAIRSQNARGLTPARPT